MCTDVRHLETENGPTRGAVSPHQETLRNVRKMLGHDWCRGIWSMVEQAAVLRNSVFLDFRPVVSESRRFLICHDLEIDAPYSRLWSPPDAPYVLLA